MATKITGRERLRAILKTIPEKAKVRLQADLTLAGRELNIEQRGLVPVDKGDLRASIKSIPFSRGGIGVVITAGGPATTREVRAGSGQNYDYAMAQELGTQDMLANPFFYPPYRHRRTKIKRGVAVAVRKALKDAIKI